METKPVPTPLPIGHSFFDRVIDGGYYYSDDYDRVLFEKLASGRGTPKEYTASLKFLSKCLESYHNEKTIIIIVGISRASGKKYLPPPDP